MLCSTAGKILVGFLFGFMGSRAFDQLLNSKQVESTALPKGLTNIRLSNEQVRQVRSEVTTTATPPKLEDTGFKAIVQTAYQRAFIQPTVKTSEMAPAKRPTFDVNWWEKRSNLTTMGGLNHEDRILLGKIYGQANSVFEWGLGESTYIANHVQVPRYAGIDSDPAWVGMARDKVASHFRFYLGDIGKTGNWGFPNDKDQPKNILNYQLSPLIVEPDPFDVYMIDGRWRLASLLAAFLHASDRGAPHSETIGLIHDCQKTASKGRTGYKNADHLLDMVDHSGHVLCVYKRKPETTDEQLKDIWHQYMNDVGRR